MGDKIVGKDGKVGAYVNENGEYLKLANNKLSVYSNDPQKPHSSTHVKVNEKEGTFTVTTQDEDRKEKREESTGNCYLTTACIKHFKGTFYDDCEELTILRWFRDNYVSQEDVEQYYKTAPIILDAIESTSNSDTTYDYIYENVVSACVDAIKSGDYDFAYNRYKNSVLTFEKSFVN